MTVDERQRILDEWLARHKGLLFKVVRAYGFTDQDREDLFQEVAIQLWRSIPNFRAESAVTTWIYRVAIHSAIAWTRKEQNYRNRTEALSGIESVLMKTPQAKDEQLQWLYDQIAQLEPIDRSLMLLLLDGFSYREMSAVLGISESNVGVKVGRIKNRLATLTKEAKTYGF